MKPYSYQEEIADEGYQILKDNYIVYLAMEERTGKTLTSILIAEMSKVPSWLVITKKKAIEGWEDTLSNFTHAKEYKVINYESLHKITKSYKGVILDEAHSNVASFPKPSKRWKDTFKHTRGKPIIYLSATPYAQGTQLLYHQFKLSSRSPFKKYTNGYKFFREFGIPNMTRLPHGLQEMYNKFEDARILEECKHLFITKTRAELEFKHEPTDNIINVELDKSTKDMYNRVIKDKYLEIADKELICDTPMKLRTSLHMIEGGVLKIDDDYIVLNNKEKVNAIKERFGDNSNLAIMYNYVAEGQKLREEFREAHIYQGTSFAEGVDLSHIENLVVYSQDFSTARHSQRRARQANKQRLTPITVHFLLIPDGVSEQVYKTVSLNKTNFIDTLFERKTL